MRETTATGREAVALASTLLRRARRADPVGGTWEAADLHWWWRKPRASDDLAQTFWLDDEGPAAAVLLTSWKDTWQCDLLLVPDVPSPAVEVVWARALELMAAHVVGRVEVPVREDAADLRALVEASGIVVGETDDVAWLDVALRPASRELPDGFVLVDRSERAGTPHHMRERNGDEVGERLAVSPLYDPALDLAVETTDGRLAGYSLYWYDPATRVGLVEPVRVEDEFQRLGLATAMLTHGLDRLAARGAARVKICFGTEAAGAVYQGVGFVPTSRDVWYVGHVAKVVTLCGSTRFEAELAEVNRRLTLEGCVVISLGLFDLPDRTPDASDLQGRLASVHLQKIRMAHEVYVVDPGGYVGESTRREIAYAESLGKPVRYLSRESSAPTGDVGPE